MFNFIFLSRLHVQILWQFSHCDTIVPNICLCCFIIVPFYRVFDYFQEGKNIIILSQKYVSILNFHSWFIRTLHENELLNARKWGKCFHRKNLTRVLPRSLGRMDRWTDRNNLTGRSTHVFCNGQMDTRTDINNMTGKSSKNGQMDR